MTAHRLAPEAAAELDEIWYYVAKETGDPARADRIVDAITARFAMLASHPLIGRRRDDLRPGLRSVSVDDWTSRHRGGCADESLNRQA